MINYEFDTGSGNIDPWTLKRLSKAIVTDDIAYWIKVEGTGCYTFRCLPNTEDRIKSGEDPEIVLMDALEFWRPHMTRRFKVLSHGIEIGTGYIDTKSWWRYLAKGESYLITNGRYNYWVYIDSDPPFPLDQKYLVPFMDDIKSVRDEENFKMTLEIWKEK